MSTIPNWPVLVTQWGAPYGANGGTPAAQNVDISNRVIGSIGFKAGKQYELDSAQAGELTATIRNDDAVLDPVNSSSPFAGHIAPYQPFSVVAQYPPSANLLTYFQATGGAGFTTGSIPAGQHVFTGTDPGGTGTIVAQSASPHDTAFNFAVPASYGAGQFIMAFTTVPAEPGAEYTFSTNVMNTTAGVTGPVQIAFGWYSPTFSPGATTWSYGPVVNMTPNVWYSISATTNAPANACGMAVGIVTGGTPTGAWNIEAYDSQISYGGLATYADPGTWYSMFTGWVERWPSQWKDAGQYGTLNATVVDAMALLSQGQLSDPFTEEITSAGASWCYPLSDSSSASQAVEANGLFPPIQAAQTTVNGGTLTFGNDIEATNVTGIFTAGGVDPSVVSITPGGTAGSSAVVGTAYLSLDDAGIVGPQNSALFTRMIAWRCTDTSAKTSAYASCLWTAYDGAAGQAGDFIQMGFGMTSSTAGDVFGTVNYASGINDTYSPGASFNPADGNWHLMMFGYNSATGAVMLSVDGNYSLSSATAGATVTGILKDSVGGNIWPGNQGTEQFEGDIAYVAEFPSLLTSTQVSRLYGAWFDACSGDTATQRYQRILRYANYTGPTALGNGVLTTSMGPATDLSGSDALTCLENVVTSENGNHYVSSNGTLTFTGRGFRYNRPTPTYIFGEAQSSGEWPYEDAKLDYDTTHLANDITITQNFTGQDFFAVNSVSQLAYFDRTMTRTVNVNNANECQAAAYFLSWRYGQPLTRVSSITINPAALAGMWPVALSIDVNMCIQVNRRPPGCPEISLLLWVENKQWTISDDGNAKLVLQCSPAIPENQGQFAVWQAQVVTATAGSSTITINNATDQVNALNGQLYPGQPFVIQANGSVAAETLTIQSVQVTGTSWTTGTITLTTNLALTHAAGTAVSETTSVTNLNTYNTESELGSVMFCY